MEALIILFAIFFIIKLLSDSGDDRKPNSYTGNYVKINTIKGLKFEHRAVAENVLKRKLVKGEVVHHINGKRYDNRPANLCVMSRIDHDELHNRLRSHKHYYGRYPLIGEQKDILRGEYDCIILSDAKRKNEVVQASYA